MGKQETGHGREGTIVKKKNNKNRKFLTINRWEEKNYSPHWEQIPNIFGWIFAVSALLSLIGFFLRYTPFSSFFEVCYLLLSLLGIPAASKAGTAALLGLISILFFLRKRLAVVVTVLFEITNLIAVRWIINADFLNGYRENLVILTIYVITIAVIVLLLYSSFMFRGRFRINKIISAGGFFLLGQALVFTIGMIWFPLYATGNLTTAEWAKWVFSKLWGASFLHLLYPKPVGTEHLFFRWIDAGLGLLSAAVVVISILILFSASSITGRSRAEDLLLRHLLDEYGAADSLGYYATRDNRSIIFSADQRAAVTYSVSCGVAMAGGDPVGDPGSWLAAIGKWRDYCYANGLIPAVISASESGARAYRKCGMRVRSMGDEAIIITNGFQLNSPSCRPLQAAVRRIQRENIEISIRRQSQIDAAELQELALAAELFRQGEERGFSMALDRMFAAQDGEQMVVTARGADGQIQALLTFVPWGLHGLSLNLMRRHRSAANGIIEAMVVALITQGRDQGIEKISLNFAMLREVLVEGEAVDASATDRLKRFLFLQASRFWQLESLYQSNARYMPEWFPRYFCFPSDPLMTLALLAAAQLEGFLPGGGILETKVKTTWQPDTEYLAELEQMRQHRTAKQLAVKLNDQQATRYRKAEALTAAGRDPFPPGFSGGEKVADFAFRLQNWAQEHCSETGTAAAETTVLLAGNEKEQVLGRISARRNHGGVKFWELSGQGSSIQVIFTESNLSASDWQDLRLLDLGDQILVGGQMGYSDRGTPSLIAQNWRLAAKSLRPLPRKGQSLDAKTRTRDRTLTLLHDPEAMSRLQARSKITFEIRKTLHEEGFLEVETPMLQAVQGGANARPFITHINAYDTNVFLRIAPELYLKRLAVAGMDAVFEMGRSFRNEGADLTHNPEFTSLEVYRAGWDYQQMATLTEQLVAKAATAVHGEPVVHRWLTADAIPPGQPGSSLPASARLVNETEAGQCWAVDITPPWPKVSVYQAISSAVGREITPETTVNELQEIATLHQVSWGPVNEHGALIGDLYDTLVEEKTLLPTFYYDFPVSTSPLTRQHRVHPALAERWDLVAWGMELGTAYTELTDPREQRKRFTQQSLAAAAGDPEAMSLDEDFLRCLELGLLPTGGLGIGIDRLAMLITGGNIRQVLAFPFVRPKSL